MEVLSFILGVIGAAAWLPSIAEYFRIKNREIKANIVDYKVCYNAVMNHANKRDKIEGTILLLAINLYIPDRSYFVDEYEINISLQGKTKTKVTTIDGDLTLHYEKGDVDFKLPNEYNFNLHREIVAEKDNIRIFKVILENVSVDSITKVSEIEFIFNDGKMKKTIKVTPKDLPDFNKMNFLTDLEVKR